MILTYHVNLAGPYHIKKGIPCQDSWAVKGSDQGLLVAAVADGLGSEQHSDIGSFIAVHTAVDYCAERVTRDMTADEILNLIKRSFVFAYMAILQKTAADQLDSSEYDTTLCMAVYDGTHLYYGQSGDSGIVILLENGEYRKVTAQQRDEEGNVFPLCFGPEKWEFGFVQNTVSSVLLMTDGVFEQICPPFWKDRQDCVNVLLARKFAEWFDCSKEEVPMLQAAAGKYLANYPDTVLYDDKTIIAMIHAEQKASSKDKIRAKNKEKIAERARIRAKTRARKRRKRNFKRRVYLKKKG